MAKDGSRDRIVIDTTPMKNLKKDLTKEAEDYCASLGIAPNLTTYLLHLIKLGRDVHRRKK